MLTAGDPRIVIVASMVVALVIGFLIFLKAKTKIVKSAGLMIVFCFLTVASSWLSLFWWTLFFSLSGLAWLGWFCIELCKWWKVEKNTKI
jgi:uncharacterized membrane protein